MFDEFVAEVRCPCCQGEDDAPMELVMQTHLRDADGSSLRVGFVFDPIDLDPENILGSGYLLVASPMPPDTVRLADTWYCRKCEAEYWAIVEIVGLRLEKISPVPMDRSTLRLVHYIGALAAEGLAMQLLGDAAPAPDDAKQLDFVDVLRERLV